MGKGGWPGRAARGHPSHPAMSQRPNAAGRPILPPASSRLSSDVSFGTIEANGRLLLKHPHLHQGTVRNASTGSRSRDLASSREW
jgi:hypothetical protein